MLSFCSLQAIFLAMVQQAQRFHLFFQAGSVPLPWPCVLITTPVHQQRASCKHPSILSCSSKTMCASKAVHQVGIMPLPLPAVQCHKLDQYLTDASNHSDQATI